MSRKKILYLIGVAILAIVLLVVARYIRDFNIKDDGTPEQTEKSQAPAAKTYSLTGKVIKVESDQLTLEVMVPGVSAGGVAIVSKQQKRALIGDGTILVRRMAQADTESLRFNDFKVGSEVAVYTISDFKNVAELTATKIELIK